MNLSALFYKPERSHAVVMALTVLENSFHGDLQVNPQGRQLQNSNFTLFHSTSCHSVLPILQYDFSEVTRKKILLLRLGTTYHKSEKNAK